MRINRREFVHQTAQGALAAGAIGAANPVSAETAEESVAAERPLLPIVDTHQHLWDLGKFRLPWLKPGEPLNRSFLMKDYLQAVEGFGVVRSVYMEVDVDPKQLVAEAEYVIELCQRTDNPTCAAVIGGRPAAEDFEQYITRFKDVPYVKGIRRLLFQPEKCLERPFVAGVRLLGELDMSFDLCVPPTGLLTAAKLVDACRHTRFILDHCGNADPKAFLPAAGQQADPQAGSPSHRADQWRRDIAQLAKRQNVVCKISGIVAQAPKGSWTAEHLAPIVNHCLEVFGPDRVVFGSDWPVCTRVATLGQWVTALKEVIRTRPEVDQRKLLHDNAVRFYGLA